MEIVLDLDGVLVQCAEQVLKTFDRKLDGPWPVMQWDIGPLVGLSMSEIWEHINEEHGPDWWSGLDKYPWFNDVVDLVVEFADDFILCTSPVSHVACAHGKAEWIIREFGNLGDHFIGAEKHWLAGPKRVLIDDNDTNCQKFINSGGSAILFPQRWNANYKLVDDRIGYLKQQLINYRSVPVSQLV